jgi:hypothetical protein
MKEFYHSGVSLDCDISISLQPNAVKVPILRTAPRENSLLGSYLDHHCRQQVSAGLGNKSRMAPTAFRWKLIS